MPASASPPFSITVQSPAPRTVYYEATFDDGVIRSNTSLRDGGWFRAKYEPEDHLSSPGYNDHFSSGSGATAAELSQLDLRLVQSEQVGSEEVRPRSGNYFLRHAVHYDKQYESVNGDHHPGPGPGDHDLPSGDPTKPVLSGSRDKPRTMFSLSNPVYQHDFDREVWLGFSLFIPLNHAHDYATRAHQGGMSILGVYPDTEFTQFTLKTHAAATGTTEHWWLYYAIRDWTIDEPPSGGPFDDPSVGIYRVDLGDVALDQGKWTDYVIRYRLNPFKVPTNASTAGGKDQLYGGNRGILQLWKSEGAVDQQGNRPMVLKLDRVDTPIGLVPHPTLLLQQTIKIYKYGWKKNLTTNTGRVWLGVDEWRFGYADEGTGYADVLPGAR